MRKLTGLGVHAKSGILMKPRVHEQASGNWNTRGMLQTSKTACTVEACNDLAYTRMEVPSKKRVHLTGLQEIGVHAECGNILNTRVL